MAKPALSVYRAKRNFSITDEPAGRRRLAPTQRLRFVIQKHAARRLHYDLRLEFDGVFKSWAVTRGPSVDPSDKRLAVQVEEHPLEYGDFEGNIPKGEYGGGAVQVWDRGYWSPEGGKTPQEAFDGGDLKFTLDGQRLHGSWVLVRMRGDRYGSKKTNWLLIKHRDADAKPGDTDALLKEDRSVASGRTLKQIAAGVGKQPKPFMLAKSPPVRAEKKSKTPPRRKPVRVAKIPAFIEPQLAKLVERVPQGSGWVHEVKLDGYRAQLHVVHGRAAIRTRNGLDWTERFAAIAADAKVLADCVIDGEIVALDSVGLPSFSALQAALSADKSEDLTFFAFDLLFEGREDLRGLPLVDRKGRLQSLLSKRGVSGRLHYVAHIESSGSAVYASACKMGLEGIVSKQFADPYRSGRNASWLKIKCRAGQEVVIGGWTTQEGAVRSLLAGVYHEGKLGYVGRIGTGYGRAAASLLLPRLKKLTRTSSPFKGKNAPPKEKNIRWLSPSLVAEIEFAGWTDSGMIRQAAFKGLRQDKAARDVVRETSAPAATAPVASSTREAAKRKSDASVVVLGVTISKPEKALWPDGADGTPITKSDLAHYYATVGEWMLPHLAGRPCSLVRLPDGLGCEKFFQRHAMLKMSPFFTSVKIRGDKAPYLKIDRVEALAAAAQIGAVEIHPWNCAPGNPEVAGRLVFDLDPAPDLAFEAVIDAALEIRDRLTATGLESFCKTTGGKGLHVVSPLTSGKGAVRWDAAKNFAHVLCAQMAQDNPKKYLDNMSKRLRVGKIFLDYLRNDKTATAVAVLSPRARNGAPVSMPIHWKAVRHGLDPMKFTLRSAPGILQKTKPWEEYDAAARSLKDAIRVITRRK